MASAQRTALVVDMTGRCRFELVQKAARMSFTGLATLSAPTELALDTARTARPPLASDAPDDTTVFDGEGAGNRRWKNGWGTFTRSQEQ